MKKIIYTMFIMIICFSAFCSIKKVNAESQSIDYYTYLDSKSQKYYDALEKMAYEDMFFKNRFLDLVKEEIVTTEDIEQYVYGNNFIKDRFELAKKAFFLDHEEFFYIDENKITIDLFINEYGKYVCNIGGLYYEDVFVEGVVKEELKKELQKYTQKVNQIIREAEVLETVEEKVNCVFKDSDPKTIKACLDGLNIPNFIYEYKRVEEGNYKNTLINIYVKDGQNLICENHETAETLIQTEYHFSNSYSELNTLFGSNPFLLEVKSDYNKDLILASKKVIKEGSSDLCYEISFFKGEELQSTLNEKQLVLLPYPQYYGYKNSNVDYLIEKKVQNSNEYVAIEHVATQYGIAVELSESCEVRITILEGNRDDHKFLVLTNEGGRVSLENISCIHINQELTFTILPTKGYKVDRILLDGKDIVVSEGSLQKYTLKYSDIKTGSVLQVLFKQTKYINEEETHIQFKEQEINATISGKEYVETGKSVVLTASTNATGNVTYQWYKNGEVIEGSNSKHLIIVGMSDEQAGEYSVKVVSSNNYCVSEAVSESFTVVNSVNLDTDPIPFVVIFSAIILLAFVAYAIIDNATHDYSKGEK